MGPLSENLRVRKGTRPNLGRRRGVVVTAKQAAEETAKVASASKHPRRKGIPKAWHRDRRSTRARHARLRGVGVSRGGFHSFLALGFGFAPGRRRGGGFSGCSSFSSVA